MWVLSCFEETVSLCPDTSIYQVSGFIENQPTSPNIRVSCTKLTEEETHAGSRVQTNENYMNKATRFWVWPLILCTACSIEGRCPGTWGAAWLRLSGTFIKDLLLYQPLEDSAVVKVGDSRGHLIAISQWSWRWKSEDHDFLSVTPKLPELMNGALQHLSKWPQQAHRLRKCLRGMWMIQEEWSMLKSWKRSGYCLELRYKLKVGKKLKIVGLRV